MLHLFVSVNVCCHVVGVYMYVRQVPGCSQAAGQLQQRAEIKRFSWRLAPIVLYSDMCLWQCATHTHTTQLTLLIVTNTHMHSQTIRRTSSSVDIVTLCCPAEAGTTDFAATPRVSGRHHHQAEPVL